MEDTNVLHLLHSLDVGGAERLVLSLCHQLKKNKRFSPIVCGLTNNRGLQNEFERLNIPLISLGKADGFDTSIPLKIRKIIKEKNISIIHSHNVGAWIYGVFTQIISPVKLVHTEHSNVFEHEKFRFVFERFLAVFTSKIIADSQMVADYMVTKQHIAQKKIITIWNGVDIDLFQNTIQHNGPPEAWAKNKLVLGCVARLVPVKDHNTLLSAFKLIISSFPETHLLLVGDGPERERIEEKADQLNISQNVTISGFTDDVRPYLALTDIFVLSSLSEGIPISLLEAMASGLPVVATSVGGTPEVIENGITGYLVPPNSPLEFSKKVKLLLKDNNKRKLMGENAFNRVCDHFSLQEMTRLYQNVYFDS